MKSYTYVISDIHGELDAFKEMLNKIKFKNSDMMYIIGDVIDRGPDSVETLKYIMDKENMVLLAGNHEHMAVMCLNRLLKEITEKTIDEIESGETMGVIEEWQLNGGAITLSQLLVLGKSNIIKIYNYLTHLKLYKELEIGNKKFLLVHAGLGNFKKNKKMKEYSIWDLCWERQNYNKKYFDDKYIITGHTPTQNIKENENPGYIYINNNNIGIDCGATYGERLGCLRLDDMKEYYVDIIKEN